mmetsp:Transcript_71340/g.118567  ORF Transcript_71340/g.118567 Transcript_71340/m.118567 type:complete len:200 (+) Transcript_71340:3-602(+)
MDAKGGISRYGADPYVRITLLGTSKHSSLTVQSSFLRNETNPKWNDVLVLPIPATAFGGGRAPQLKVQLFDKDWHKADDFIAEAIVALPTDLASSPGKAVCLEKYKLQGGVLPSHLSRSSRRRIPDVPFSFKATIPPQLGGNEIGGALKQLGFDANCPEAKVALQKFDTRGFGTISLQEFNQLLREIRHRSPHTIGSTS